MELHSHDTFSQINHFLANYHQNFTAFFRNQTNDVYAEIRLQSSTIYGDVILSHCTRADIPVRSSICTLNKGVPSLLPPPPPSPAFPSRSLPEIRQLLDHFSQYYISLSSASQISCSKKRKRRKKRIKQQEVKNEERNKIQDKLRNEWTSLANDRYERRSTTAHNND